MAIKFNMQRTVTAFRHAFEEGMRKHIRRDGAKFGPIHEKVGDSLARGHGTIHRPDTVLNISKKTVLKLRQMEALA